MSNADLEPPRHDHSIELFARGLSRELGAATVARHGLALLRGPVPSVEDALLDGHLRELRRRLANIATALAGVRDESVFAVTSGRSLAANADLDEVLDAVALWLLATAMPSDIARDLAVCTARLIEDGQVLHHGSRRLRPLGRGFEQLLKERLARRFAFLPDHAHYLAAARRWKDQMLEEPDVADAEIEHEIGKTLTDEIRTWLDLERRVAMLRRVRRNKTEDGHIRWYLRRHPRRDVVLDRFGVQGHWIISTDGSTADRAAVGTAVERVFVPDPGAAGAKPGWHLVTGTKSGDPVDRDPAAPRFHLTTHVLVPPQTMHDVDPLDVRAGIRRTARIVGKPDGRIAWDVFEHAAAENENHPRKPDRAREVVLRGSDDGLELLEVGPDGSTAHTIATTTYEPAEDSLIAFLETLDCVADAATPRDEIHERHANRQATLWSRALLDVRRHPPPGEQDNHYYRGLTVRLVYVPSEVEHQLGGVPLIGLAFLKDKLEQLGARVNVATLATRDFERRLPELLGADVVGVGVYIHNVEQVRALVELLRRSDFAGRIVLGGPQVRYVDHILQSIDGWDALIRGEAEDVLPKALDVLQLLHDKNWPVALERAALLSGIAFRFGNILMVCDTASRNRAAKIECPLPFDWMRGRHRRRLQMNFTRGCPYRCNFCPNHQGQLFRPGDLDDLWTYTVLATADDLVLPPRIESAIASRIRGELPTPDQPSIRVALHLLQRAGCGAPVLRSIIQPLIDFADPSLVTDPDSLLGRIGIPPHALFGNDRRDGLLTGWEIKEAWLHAKAAVIASRQLWAATETYPDRITELNRMARAPFTLMTSEDNTLVNRTTIKNYLERRRRFGLSGDVIFNPGQNTVWDLTDMRGAADEAYIATLVRQNPFEVALGVDGPSNPVIRQNNKPRYSLSDTLEVNRTLARHGATVANNYILLAPETDFLEAVEAFLLFALLPLPWRDYGSTINLRVVKEDATLAHDEGLLFAPGDSGYDEPLRFAEVAALLERWSITSRVPASEIVPLLWRIFREDPLVRNSLPLVVRRWQLDYDSDPEVRKLGQLVAERSHAEVALVDTLWDVAQSMRQDFPG